MAEKGFIFKDSATGSEYKLTFDPNKITVYGFTTVQRFLERCWSMALKVCKLPKGLGEAFVEINMMKLCISSVNLIQVSDKEITVRLFYVIKDDVAKSEQPEILDTVLNFIKV